MLNEMLLLRRRLVGLTICVRRYEGTWSMEDSELAKEGGEASSFVLPVDVNARS